MLAAVPISSAQPGEIINVVNAQLAVNPNPTGVGQTVDVIVWVQPIPPGSGELFENFTVFVLKPGTPPPPAGMPLPAPWLPPPPPPPGEDPPPPPPGDPPEILGPVDSWPVGAQLFRYTPTEVGEYNFIFAFYGQYFGSEDQTYVPAQSQTVTLTVQQDRIPGMPTAPLPEYIDGIVNTENREWSGIIGSWMMTYYDSTYNGYGDSGGGYNPYTTAPRSAHIR